METVSFIRTGFIETMFIGVSRELVLLRKGLFVFGESLFMLGDG